MKYFTGFLIVIAVALLFRPALAEEVRYYDIEIVIVESLDEEARISEVWKNELNMEQPEIFVELGQPYPGPIPSEYDPKLTFRMLPDSELRLAEEAKLLTESKNYRILYHKAWRQPGMSEETALPVHIYRSFIASGAVTTTTPAASPDMPATSLPVPSTARQQSRVVLDGYVRIILSRYLHADTEIHLITNLPLPDQAARQPTTENTLSDNTVSDEPVSFEIQRPVIYSLKQTRKMRSTEVHYLDHPVIGMLILATPYEKNNSTR